MTDQLNAHGPERIMVILHGGLAEMALAEGVFAAIRHAHGPEAHIILLTSKPFIAFGMASGYFNEVWEDKLPQWWEVTMLRDLILRLRQARLDAVYDLQHSTRTNWYFRLMGGARPDWCGPISWCSHPYMDRQRRGKHILERWRNQLQVAGIAQYHRPPVLSWLTVDVSRFGLEHKRYALLMPGGTWEKPRWPRQGFSDMADWLREHGMVPVFIGAGLVDAGRIGDIVADAPDSRAVDLSDKTSLAEIAALARGAELSVGNDTGPMYLAALSGCPSVFLSQKFSASALRVPESKHIRMVEAENIRELDTARVISETQQLLESLKK